MKRLTWLFLIVALTLPLQADVPEPKGVWQFDGPDPGLATIGVPLELVGSIEEVPGIDAGDGAIQIGEGSYYICTHGIGANGDGAKVNEWTLLIDFSYPASSRSDPPSGYSDLFQTNPTNTDDSDWTINSSGGIGIGAVGYSSAHGYTTEADTWYRLVLVVDNGVRHDLYVDGVEIFQGNEQGIDGRFSLAETLLLFCAGNSQDGDDAPINVSTVAIWDSPLDADAIESFAGAGVPFFIQKVASNPMPADGSEDVLISSDLAWTPGEYASTHEVYFSSSWADVSTAAPAARIAEGLARDANSLDVGRLDFGQTYYWRVDEVNGAPDHEVFEGKVWSFTAEPVAYPIEGITVTASSAGEDAGPENTINGSGLDEDDRHSIDAADMWLSSVSGEQPTYIEFAFDRAYKLHEMWVWNYNVSFESVLGFGFKEVTIEYSSDGAEWAILGDFEFAQASASADYGANTTIDFGGLAVQAVRLTVNSGWGTISSQYGLSEVRFLYIPVSAREPQPADGEADVSLDTVLNWRAGREAVTHDVSLGTDQQAVADGTALVDSVAANEFAPTYLVLGTTYFWKVDEVNEAEAIPLWEGDLWSFSTQEFVTVDDFESYDNEENLIYETWLDGWVNETGSTVGHLEAPFAEQTVVKSGKQSMPLFYDNTAAPISEAELALTQNWTTSGIKSLAIAFAGAAGNAGQLYVKINGTKVVYDGDAGDIALSAWQAWNIDLSTVGNVSNVTSLIIGVEGGATGVVYIDDIRLYPKTPEYITPTDPGTEGLVAYYALDGDASDGSGNGNHGTLNGDPVFAAGQVGSALDCDGVDDFVSTGKSASDLGIAGNSPRTVSSWVFTRSFGNGGIYDVGNRAADQDFCLRTYNDEENRWRIQYWSGDFDFTYDTVEKWVHFTHVHDGTHTKIYANGILIVNWEKTIDTADTNPFQIGLYGWPGNYFDGLIDEVRLFNRAVSAGEALGLSGQTTPRHKEF